MMISKIQDPEGVLLRGRAPFLRKVETRPEQVDPTAFPFTVRAFSKGIDLTFDAAVTFFVGENGSGKSTLLEALADGCGFFLRAESFYNFATYIEGISDMRAYGGTSLHQQSHGESFMSLFVNRFDPGVFILDEPEARLSPQRQLSFLRIVHDLAASGRAQFLIATHSPIILAYPGAVLYSLDGDRIEPIAYTETKHYLITRDFLNSPDRFFKHLFDR